MTAIDITQLPPPDVIETLDFDAILADHKAYYISLWPAEQQAAIAASLELESEPVLKTLENAAYRELVLRARLNDEARAVMLAFAKDADLDYIGITYYRTPRLIVVAADPAANPPVAEVKETDTAYRERLQIAPEGWSTAGPTEAYEFHALSAHGSVKSVGVTSPQPGTTLISVLSHEAGGIPSQPVIDAVDAALNVEKVRPNSEEVVVQATEIIDYQITLSIYILTGPVGETSQAAAQAALEAYAAESFKNGASIIVSEISKRAKQPGVHDVDTGIMVNIPIAKTQAARCTGITVNIAGIVQP